jgi:hypothetical protein
VRRSLDVELIARRAVERLPLVGADLGFDVERAQQAERTARNGRAGEIEMDVDVAAAAEVDTARDVEEPEKLGQAVAVRCRRDCSELLAQIVRGANRKPLELEQAALVRDAVGPYEPRPPAETTRWHGTNKQRRLRAQKLTAARAAPGAPDSAASSP